jgi:cyclase
MTMNRRGFIGVSVMGLVAGAFGRGFAHSQQAVAVFRDLRRNVGMFTARGGTIGWLSNRSGGLVVDSQYADTARACLAGLAERHALPLHALINTHHHGDHTGGNGEFRDAVRRIVAHTRVPELQRRASAGGSGSAQIHADTTFDEEWSVVIDDETVLAKHYGAAHTGGDCIVCFTQADVVHVGDLVFNRAYPFIDRAGGASVTGWIKALEQVTAAHGSDTLYIFGHGNPAFGVTGGRADVLVQRDFLSAILDIAQRGVAAGRSRDETAALTSLPAFPDHAPLGASLTLAAAVRVAWDEVSGR